MAIETDVVVIDTDDCRSSDNHGRDGAPLLTAAAIAAAGGATAIVHNSTDRSGVFLARSKSDSFTKRPPGDEFLDNSHDSIGSSGGAPPPIDNNNINHTAEWCRSSVGQRRTASPALSATPSTPTGATLEAVNDSRQPLRQRLNNTDAHADGFDAPIDANGHDVDDDRRGLARGRRSRSPDTVSVTDRLWCTDSSRMFERSRWTLEYTFQQCEREYAVFSYRQSAHFFTAFVLGFGIPPLFVFVISSPEFNAITILGILLLVISIAVGVVDLILAERGRQLAQSWVRGGTSTERFVAHIKRHNLLIFLFLLFSSFLVGLSFHSVGLHCNRVDDRFFLYIASSTARKQFCERSINTATVIAFLAPTLSQRVDFPKAAIVHAASLGAALFGRIANPPTDAVAEITADVVIFCIAGLSLLLTYFSERSRRGKFESHVLTLYMREELNTEQHAITAFVDSLLPPVMHHRMTGLITVVVDIAPSSTCVAVGINELTRYAQRMLPPRAALCCSAIAVICDEEAQAARIDRIRTTGDVVVAVSNLLARDAFHANRAAHYGVSVIRRVCGAEIFREFPVSLSVSMHTGELIGACVGLSYQRYDLFGPAWEVARALLPYCEQDQIVCTEATVNAFRGDFTVCGALGVTMPCSATNSTHELFMVMTALEPEVISGTLSEATSVPSSRLVPHSIIHRVFPTTRARRSSTAAAETAPASPSTSRKGGQGGGVPQTTTVKDASRGGHAHHENAPRVNPLMAILQQSERFISTVSLASLDHTARQTSGSAADHATVGDETMTIGTIVVPADGNSADSVHSRQGARRPETLSTIDAQADIAFLREKYLCGILTRFTNPAVERDFIRFRRVTEGPTMRMLLLSIAIMTLVMFIFIVIVERDTKRTASRIASGVILATIPIVTAGLLLLRLTRKLPRVVFPLMVLFVMAALPVALVLARPSVLGNNIMFVQPPLFILLSVGVFNIHVEVALLTISTIVALGVQVANEGVLQSNQFTVVVAMMLTMTLYSVLSNRRWRDNYVVVCELKRLSASVNRLREMRDSILRAVLPLPVQQRAIASRGNDTIDNWASPDVAFLSLRFHELASRLIEEKQRDRTGALLIRAIRRTFAPLETFVANKTPLSIVEIFGDAAAVAGPLCSECTLADCLSAILHLVGHLREACDEDFTAVATIDEAVSVLVNTECPLFQLYGPAVMQARALAGAAPAGAVVATAKFASTCASVGVPFKPASVSSESWAVRGSGIVRVFHM